MVDEGHLEPVMNGADGDLLDLAYSFALGAVDAAECDVIAERLRKAGPRTQRRFDDAVREARETMAHAAVVSAVEPPAGLRARLLRDIQAQPRQSSGTPTPSS